MAGLWIGLLLLSIIELHQQRHFGPEFSHLAFPLWIWSRVILRISTFLRGGRNCRRSRTRRFARQGRFSILSSESGHCIWHLWEALVWTFSWVPGVGGYSLSIIRHCLRCKGEILWCMGLLYVACFQSGEYAQWPRLSQKRPTVCIPRLECFRLLASLTHQARWAGSGSQ